MADPQLLICDEPTGSLDRRTADDVLTLLQTLGQQAGKTVVIVTHDLKVADYVDRTITIENGAIVRDALRATPAP